MKRREVAQIVATLAAAYPNAQVSEATSAVYERMLLDLDFETTERAVARLLGTSRFLPTIAEIRGAAADLALGPVRSGAEAWLDVIEEIRRVGQYEAPKFADPLVAEIVRKCGWYGLCTDDNLVSDRARFIEAYDAAAGRKRADVASGIPLPATAALEARSLPPAPQAKPALQVAPANNVEELQRTVLRDPPTRAQPRPQFQRRMSAEEIRAAIGMENETEPELREAVGGER